jgi:hypothetical protein
MFDRPGGCFVVLPVLCSWDCIRNPLRKELKVLFTYRKILNRFFDVFDDYFRIVFYDVVDVLP